MVAYTNPVLVRGFISTLNMRWWSRMTLPYFSGGWLNHRPDFMGDFIWPVPKIPTSGLWGSSLVSFFPVEDQYDLVLGALYHPISYCRRCTMTFLNFPGSIIRIILPNIIIYETIWNHMWKSYIPSIISQKSYMKSYETHKFSVLLSVRQAYLGNDLWAAASEMEASRCRIWPAYRRYEIWDITWYNYRK